MSEWPHEKIHTVALRYIRKATMKEDEWRFTWLETFPEQLTRNISLLPAERCIVGCFINAQCWYAMTTARVLGMSQGSSFDCSPVEVDRWAWGDFKHAGRAEVGIATLYMKNRATELALHYETGYASMAPIHYERFWTLKYPVLNKLR